MKCIHCLVEFYASRNDSYVDQDADGVWGVLSYRCPSCNRLNLFLVCAKGKEVYNSHFQRFTEIVSTIPIRPFGSNRPPCPPDVPANIADDYREACVVLPFSAKASSALSRRCLQNLLVDAAKITKKDLSDQIQEVLDSRQLPSQLANSIDAIRNIGNFAAHPLKSKSSGEVLPVEPEEAVWNLDVIEALFDFYYVQPAIIAKKREALNAKLQEAGKPPMK